MCCSMEVDNMEKSEAIEPDDNSEFAEVDPSGRYGRYNEELGKGAHKKVYKAFDKVEGIEVAWNKLHVEGLREGSVERLYSEVNLLRTLKHKNIIKFYTSWIDPVTQNVNFITELFTSGTLRQYREKHKNVDVKAIKNWARQILRGLQYLHSHDPPIIHRDLKCDNIFINGNQGEVKIGDFGLAAIMERAIRPRSVLGTPEFMAPELYEENYNELVDIYAFGMCLLELVIFEYPYSECNNAVQVYKKVLAGIKPEGLCKFKNLELRRFVEKCLVSASERLPASELLKDPFLQEDPVDYVDRGSPSSSSANSKGEHTNDGRHGESSCSDDNDDNLQDDNKSKDFKLKGKLGQDKISLKLRINDHGHLRCIQFPFDLEADTAISVASEMVGELEISDQDVIMIADMIDTEIRSLVPDWKPGASFDETDDPAAVDEQPSEENPMAVAETDLLTPATLEPELPSPATDLRNTDGEGLMFGRFEEVSAGSLSSDSESEHVQGEERGIFNHLVDFRGASSTDRHEMIANWIHTSVASYAARNGVITETGLGDLEPPKDTAMKAEEDMCSSTVTDTCTSHFPLDQMSQLSTSDCVMADAESAHKDHGGIRVVDNSVVPSLEGGTNRIAMSEADSSMGTRAEVHGSPESVRSVNSVARQGVSSAKTGGNGVNSVTAVARQGVSGAKTGGSGSVTSVMAKQGICGVYLEGIHGIQSGTYGIRGGIPGTSSGGIPGTRAAESGSRTAGVRVGFQGVSSTSDTNVITGPDGSNGIRGGTQGICGDEKTLLKNEMLQKKLAEMEARTLEKLSSKNGYSCSGMVKKTTPISIL